MLNKKNLLVFLLVLSLTFVVMGCSSDDDLVKEELTNESRIKVNISLEEVFSQVTTQSHDFTLDKFVVTAKSDEVTDVSKTELVEDGQEEITVVLGDLAATSWQIKVEAFCKDGYSNYSGESHQFKLAFEERTTINITLKPTEADLRMPVEVPEGLDPDSGWIELIASENFRDDIDFTSENPEFFFSDLKPREYTLKGEFKLGVETLSGEKTITLLPGRENVIPLSLSGELSIGDIKWQLPPEAPSDLSASVNVDKNVNLNWQHQAANIKGYYIYRSLGAEGQRRLLNGHQLLETNQYTDTEVEAGKSYWYWVQAYDQDGYTGELASVEITVEVGNHTADGHYLDLGEDSYGPSEDAVLYSVERTADGGYIAVGYADGFENTDDGFVVKLDSRGQEEWTATYHDSSYYNRFYDVFENEVGEYILAGTTKNDNEGYVVKIDSNGQEIWSETYTFDGADGRFRTVAAASDGGYILGGQTEVSSTDGHGWLVKIAETGAKVWEDVYGQSRQTMIWDIVQSDEGGYVIAADNAGGSGSNDNGVIMQIDQAGILLCEQEIDDAYRFRSIVKADDGYLLAGSSGSGWNWDDDGYLIKINKEGNYQWHHTFGGDDRDIKFKGIEAGLDGGYILTGRKESDAHSYETDGIAAYILKVDDEGNQDWDQVYDHSDNELLWSVQPAIDGYLGVGWSRSFGTGSDRDGYVIKMNRNGEIE